MQLECALLPTMHRNTTLCVQEAMHFHNASGTPAKFLMSNDFVYCSVLLGLYNEPNDLEDVLRAFHNDSFTNDTDEFWYCNFM